MYRWRLLAYKYGDEEQRPSNFDGHASAIRFNLSNQKIEFVDHDGFLVSDLEEIKWEKFDFGPKKKNLIQFEQKISLPFFFQKKKNLFNI